jgi:hypothetical protein
LSGKGFLVEVQAEGVSTGEQTFDGDIVEKCYIQNLD